MKFLTNWTCFTGFQILPFSDEEWFHFLERANNNISFADFDNSTV